MKFSIKESADLFKFTEEIFNEKLHFLRSGLFLGGPGYASENQVSAETDQTATNK